MLERNGETRQWVNSLAPRSYFNLADAPGSRHAAENALSRLASPDGPITRVKPGLYWKRPPAGRFGQPTKPDPYEAAMFAIGAGAGPAGLSAASALGLTTQVPMKPEIAVVGRAPKGLDAVRLVSRANQRRLELEPMEIAVLEALRIFPRHAEVSEAEALKRIGDLAKARKIDLERIKWAAETERRPAVINALDSIVA